MAVTPPTPRQRTRLVATPLDQIPAKADLGSEDLSLLKITYLPMTILKARRARAEEARLAELIARYRYVIPVIALSDGRIYDGVSRFKALRTLGYSHAPAFLVDGMPEVERQALALALNKTAERSVWNEKVRQDTFRFICKVDP